MIIALQIVEVATQPATQSCAENKAIRQGNLNQAGSPTGDHTGDRRQAGPNQQDYLSAESINEVSRKKSESGIGEHGDRKDRGNSTPRDPEFSLEGLQKDSKGATNTVIKG